jgi:hypothetical protein
LLFYGRFLRGFGEKRVFLVWFFVVILWWIAGETVVAGWPVFVVRILPLFGNISVEKPEKGLGREAGAPATGKDDNQKTTTKSSSRFPMRLRSGQALREGQLKKQKPRQRQKQPQRLTADPPPAAKDDN